MKKLLSSGLAVLAAGLLAASLAACKNSSNSDNTGETYTPSASTDSGSTSTSTSSGTSTSTSTTSGTRVVATGTAPAGFVAVDGRSGGAGDITPLFACDHEVTQGEYETYCCYEGTYYLTNYSSHKPTDEYGKGSSYPAYYVSWYDALVYSNLRSMAEGLTPCFSREGSTDPASWYAVCMNSDGKYFAGGLVLNDDCFNASANGYRLPTFEEWVYLAKGGFEEKSYKYAGSDNINDVAWYEDNSGNKTHEVKGKAPNSLGLYDMTGNVDEWCLNEVNNSGFGWCADCAGGYWGDISRIPDARASNYMQTNCTVRYSSCGFRVVRNAQ